MGDEWHLFPYFLIIFLFQYLPCGIEELYFFHECRTGIADGVADIIGVLLSRMNIAYHLGVVSAIMSATIRSLAVFSSSDNGGD